MNVEIVKAQKHHLLEVLYIIRECSRQLLNKGVKYWNNSLADYYEISADIAKGYVYLVKFNYVPVGTITIRPDEAKQTLTIERLAIYPAFQKKGLAQRLLEFAKQYAASNKLFKIVGNIPVDDVGLTQLLEQNSFIRKGEEPIPMNDFKVITYEFTS